MFGMDGRHFTYWAIIGADAACRSAQLVRRWT
jgi:hypothetical protein